jgi:DNA-binding NarL/FixJ family response regulator
MKHIDTSAYRDSAPGMDCLAHNDRTIVLVTIAGRRDADAIARIKSVLPGSEIVNLSQLYIERDVDEQPAISSTGDAPLTGRQAEILDYVLIGLSNKEIGRKMGLSHFTVRNHVSNILRILNFQCRREMRRSLHIDRAIPQHAMVA